MTKGIEIDKVVDDKGTKVEIITARRPVHEVARWMLALDPCGYVVALATMYGEEETVIPPKGIPGLISSFKQAKERMIEHIDRPITILEKRLREQAREAEKKEEKEA